MQVRRAVKATVALLAMLHEIGKHVNEDGTINGDELAREDH